MREGRNTHVKYQSPSTYQSKVMTDHEVKVYADRQMDRQKNRESVSDMANANKAGPYKSK